MPEPGFDRPMAARYKVKITRNGPCIVSGGVPLSEQIIKVDANGDCHGWKEGKRYPAREHYALCRCGQSKTLPFCDGTHTRVEFDGTEVASRKLYRDKAVEKGGPDLRLTDAEDLCSEARFCQRAGTVWDLAQRIDDPGARKKAVEEACDCPSGRLVVWTADGKSIEPEFEPSIGLVTDEPAGKMGPIWVRGGIPIESADGRIYETRNRVTLCRCGKSLNQPFCDGSHFG